MLDASKKSYVERAREEWNILYNDAGSALKREGGLDEALNLALKARGVALTKVKETEEIVFSNDQLILICGEIKKRQHIRGGIYRNFPSVVNVCGIAAEAAEGTLGHYRRKGAAQAVINQLDSMAVSLRKGHIDVMLSYGRESAADHDYFAAIWAYKGVLSAQSRLPYLIHSPTEMNNMLHCTSMLAADDSRASGAYSKELIALKTAISTAVALKMPDSGVKPLKMRAVTSGVMAGEAAERNLHFGIAHEAFKDAIGFAWEAGVSEAAIAGIRLKMNTCRYMLGSGRVGLLRTMHDSI
ncbi:MAG: hypothetical protein KGH66_02860 [Candidatus Micrarchaeota archaeon]|nr:hypothetical protein [Candidatus Micrarchaeota archaeon]